MQLPRIIRTRGAQMSAAAFAMAALVVPSIIASLEAWSLPHRLARLAQPDLAGGPWAAIQYALLTIGLSTALAGGVLAVYRWPWARRLVHLLLFCILLELFYRLAYGGPVSPGLLLSVPETSATETIELLAGHAILTSSLSLVAVLAVCALTVSWAGTIRFSPRRCIQVGAVAAAMIAASLAIGQWQFGGARLLAPVVAAEMRATFPFDIVAAAGAVALGLEDVRRQASSRADFRFPNAHLVDAASRSTAAEIYVVAIGETSRRANWSLFGYPRETTPRLDAIRDDLILFKRVTSNATNTILSLPLALTRAAPAAPGVARSEKSIVTLLKEAGFQTFWISNQEPSGVMSNSISQIALEADHVSFPPHAPASARIDRFDSNLVVRLDQVLAHLPKDAKAVIFLHMEGSHFGYEDRYPAGFEHFREGVGAPRALPERQMRLVDEYDNSVYFTDYNLREVIARLAACGCKGGMVFFSDHGERLFDHGLTDSDFGHGFPSVSRQEIEVPFLLWLTRAYQKADPSAVARLKANRRSAAQLHNLFETVVDLAGVDYDDRNPALSLFSDRFQPPSRLDVLNLDEEAISLPVEDDAGQD
jgi:glucan phosphoethanolaminetransferase (alkaline phosphatase superfamily)